mmetsp:Transcript_24595/g.61717  ORF Transcript_24595/g.61717 Transcript_24595/m.61717 type:complete len:259 (-) Transcript_24595:859-1635(-)
MSSAVLTPLLQPLRDSCAILCVRLLHVLVGLHNRSVHVLAVRGVGNEIALLVVIVGSRLNAESVPAVQLAVVPEDVGASRVPATAQIADPVVLVGKDVVAKGGVAELTVELRVVTSTRIGTEVSIHAALLPEPSTVVGFVVGVEVHVASVGLRKVVHQTAVLVVQREAEKVLECMERILGDSRYGVERRTEHLDADLARRDGGDIVLHQATDAGKVEVHEAAHRLLIVRAGDVHAWIEELLELDTTLLRREQIQCGLE